MNIHAIRGENMMRMKMFDVTLDTKGNMIVISGKNGEGKTSLINSIILCLGGSKTDVAKMTTKVIREGEKKAFVEVEIGDWKIKRTWTAVGKEYFEITGSNGAKFAKPQDMLNKILGDISFDPLAFTRMKPKEQKDLLLSIVDIPLDLAAHDAKTQEIFEKRTEIGREVDRLAGALEVQPDVPEDTPDEEVSIASLLKQKEEADVANRIYEKAEQDCIKARQWVANAEKELADAKAELKRAQDAKAAQAGAVPTSHFQEQIENAETINKNVRQKKQRAQMKAEYQRQEEFYEKGTKLIEQRNAQKAKALAAAEMPIDGLSFDEDGVTFGGIPFGQLSMSQKIKVSTAIGMAQNPELRLMIVHDGSLLDKDNLAALKSMAEANDFQILVEMVDDSGEMGIVIEDGEVVSEESPSAK